MDRRYPAVTLTLCLGLGIFLMGCSQEEKTSPGKVATKKDSKGTDAEGDCPSCCTPLSRAAILARASKDKPSPVEARPDATVEINEVKLKQVLADVASHKGKIVVIDIWGEFCVPCKKEFPHLVNLHTKHAKDGLVCMSIAVDEVENKAAAHAFLKKQGATFANYILSADSENWQDHWDITAVPAVIVYQDGKLLRKFTNDDPDNQYTYADVEKYLESQLAK